MKASHEVGSSARDSSRPQSTSHSFKPRQIQFPTFDSKPRTALDDNASQMRSSNLLFGQLEDDSQEDEIIFENFYETRPPARHKDQAYNLVDSMPSCTPEKRPINLSTEIRPPSRHRTPPKAVGLDLPPGQRGQKIQVESMFNSSSLSCTLDEEFFVELDNPLMRTLPNAREPRRSDSTKTRTRARNASRKKSSSSRSSQKSASGVRNMANVWESDYEVARTCETQNEASSFRAGKHKDPRKQGTAKFGAWSAIAQQKPLTGIPITLNKQGALKPFLAKKRMSVEPTKEQRDDLPDRRLEQRSGPSDLTHYKIKRKVKKTSHASASKTLPFISSLDAEFLGLFSCDEFTLH